MKTYNTNPYFDDFDQTNNFHQIMFKPGYAVQARELSQMQTIIRDQIEKFGNHIFKHGSVVIPGNSFADLGVSYIKMEPTYDGVAIDYSLFEGKTLIGVTSGIKAYVQKAIPATLTEPITFYLSYLTGSATGVIEFSNSEELYVETSTGLRANAQTTSSTGIGSLAFVNQGVYYVNGSFVFVEKQSIVIDKYSSTPSVSVLLQIDESIVSSIDDETLLDPAQGSYNYAAPGADRVQISLTLTSIPAGSAITNDFIELMRYKNGELEEHARTPKYSELDKYLARRTFDESGNYVVNGLVPKIREHLREENNGGVYPTGNSDLLVVEVDPGKAYISGFEVEKISTARIDINKARTSSHIKNTNVILRPEYGQYLIVSNIVGNFSVYNHEEVDIYNDNDDTNGSATKIGTAKVIGLDYLAGDIGTGAIYKLWITDLTLLPTFTIERAGGIRYGSGKSAYVLTQYSAPVTSGSFTVDEIISHASGRTATVRYWDINTSTLYAYKHDHTKETPRNNESITGATSGTTSVITFKNMIESVGQSGLIFAMPKAVPFSLLNPTSSSYDLSYTVQKELSITTNGSGDGSVSVSSGEQIDSVEVGTFIAVGTAGVVQNNLFSLNIAGTTLTLIGGPASQVVKVYAAVTKTDISPKSKTETSHTQVVSSPTSAITLDKTDIIGITSVIDTVGDITANYNLWNGQTDYAYERGTLTLKNGASAPTGAVTVTFTYYQHSIAGDFFCIDSYPNDILEKTTLYVSESTGTYFDLPTCIDMRPSVGSDGLFTGTGSRRNDLFISGTTFNTVLQYYVPRIDTLVINAAGKLSVLPGIPSENPLAPTVPVDQFALNIMFIPEYTKSFSEVLLNRLSVQRFTMQQIELESNRINRIEDYITLSNEEQSVVNYQVIDAVTGLDRFKTGYLVESFSQPLFIARTTSSDYSATFIGNTVTTRIENLLCELVFSESASSNFVIKGRRVMLPYTEEVFAEQPLSSRVTNINPFLVIKWDGIVSVSPSVDEWVEVRDLENIFESKTEEVVVDNFIPCPPAPSYGGSPSLPPLPATTYGGWYGSTLGREADQRGVNYWVNDFNSGANSIAIANSFMSAAKVNSENINGAVSGLSGGNTVLASKTVYSYNSAGQVVATTSGTNLNGTNFTSSSRAASSSSSSSSGSSSGVQMTNLNTPALKQAAWAAIRTR